VPPLRRRGRLADPADRETKQVIDGTHPLGVPPRQVVIDRHHVHRPARDRVPRGRQRPGERLALTRGHLGDLPGQHSQRAKKLNVERALPESPPGRLPPCGADPDEVPGAAGQAGQIRVRHLAQPFLQHRDRRQQALVRGQIHGPWPLQEPAHAAGEGAHLSAVTAGTGTSTST